MSYATEQLVQTFANQFATEGQRLVYRKNLKGPPVEVTAAERDLLIGQFRRRTGWFDILTIALTVLVMAAMAVVVVGLNLEFSELAAFLSVLFILAPIAALGIWAWNAPARLLAGRATVGQERSPEEIKAWGLANLNWSRLVTLAGGGVLLLLAVDWDRSLLSGWNPFLVVTSALAIFIAAIQAVRKLLAQQAAAKDLSVR